MNTGISNYKSVTAAAQPLNAQPTKATRGRLSYRASTRGALRGDGAHTQLTRPRCPITQPRASKECFARFCRPTRTKLANQWSDAGRGIGPKKPWIRHESNKACPGRKKTAIHCADSSRQVMVQTDPSNALAAQAQLSRGPARHGRASRRLLGSSQRPVMCECSAYFGVNIGRCQDCLVRARGAKVNAGEALRERCGRRSCACVGHGESRRHRGGCELHLPWIRPARATLFAGLWGPSRTVGNRSSARVGSNDG